MAQEAALQAPQQPQLPLLALVTPEKAQQSARLAVAATYLSCECFKQEGMVRSLRVRHVLLCRLVSSSSLCGLVWHRDNTGAISQHAMQSLAKDVCVAEASCRKA